MKSLALIILISLAGCSRAQWQEDRGHGELSQQQTPADNPQPLNPGAPPEVPPQVPDHRPPLPFADCKSQTLSIEIETSKSKESLVNFWSASSRYPRLKSTLASRTRRKTTYFMNALDANSHACQDQACADEAGWSLLQTDLFDLKGLRVMCVGQPHPEAKVADKISTDSMNLNFQD